MINGGVVSEAGGVPLDSAPLRRESSPTQSMHPLAEEGWLPEGELDTISPEWVRPTWRK